MRIVIVMEKKIVGYKKFNVIMALMTHSNILTKNEKEKIEEKVEEKEEKVEEKEEKKEENTKNNRKDSRCSLVETTINIQNSKPPLIWKTKILLKSGGSNTIFYISRI